jgi:hypothetical protein
MKDLMKPAEQEYIEKYWVSKEPQLIRLFTAQIPNLNCFSTQRDEGQHPMLHSVMNHQLRLDEGVRKLAIEITLAVERLQEYEHRDQADPRRLLSLNVWHIVKEKVASKALMRTLKEWDQLTEMKRAGQPLGQRNCTTVEQFGLPCYHDLEQAHDLAMPLPLTLFHSRWWFGGGVEVRHGWKPSYGVISQNQPTGSFLDVERPRHHIIEIANELLTFREGLTVEKQQLLDRAHVQATREILHEIQQHEAFEQSIPRVLPPPRVST